jgi:hypothetical protein
VLEASLALPVTLPAGRIAEFLGRNRERIRITFRRGLNLVLVIPDIT